MPLCMVHILFAFLSLLFKVILSSLYASIGSISGLIDSFSAAIWVYYALTFTSLLIMRVTYRKEERPFKVFFVIPLVMVFVSLAVVIFPLKDQLWESIGSFGGILLSVPVYFLFIYIGPFPKCLSFYVTFKSKLAKLNGKYTTGHSKLECAWCKWTCIHVYIYSVYFVLHYTVLCVFVYSSI